MFEQRIRDEFDRRDRTALSGGGDLATVVARGRQLQRWRIGAITGAGLAVSLVSVLAVTALIAPPRDPVATGPEGEAIYLIRPDIELPIDPEPTEIAGVNIYAGSPGPGRSFEPEGADHPFVQGSIVPFTDSPVASDDAVYLGNVGGTDLFAYGTNRVGFGGSAAETAVKLGLVNREDSGGVWVTAAPRGLAPATMHLAPSDLPAGPIGIGLTTAEGQPERFLFTWIGVPPETAVVTFAVDGETLFWQRPVARISAFVTAADLHNNTIRLVAYDAEGGVLIDAEQTG
jgi:hypothetical protein